MKETAATVQQHRISKANSTIRDAIDILKTEIRVYKVKLRIDCATRCSSVEITPETLCY